VLAEKETGNEKYYRYFDEGRRFFVPLWLERAVGKRIAFPVNNAWAKYRQVDVRLQRAGAGARQEGRAVLND
jgi:hypothetical protein